MKKNWSQNMKLAFKELKKIDPFLNEIISDYGLPKDRATPNEFSTLVKIIIGQQISRSAAKSIFQKLLKKTKISPETMLDLDLNELKKTGLSTQKINYIKDLAFKIKQEEINLADFDNLPSDNIYNILIKVKGIGEWTINNYRLFALQDVDAWPGGDLALQESIKQIKKLNSRPNFNEMNKLSEKWKPYRGAAALLLWHYYSIKK